MTQDKTRLEHLAHNRWEGLRPGRVVVSQTVYLGGNIFQCPPMPCVDAGDEHIIHTLSAHIRVVGVEETAYLRYQ